jgi:hypothetical protein
MLLEEHKIAMLFPKAQAADFNAPQAAPQPSAGQQEQKVDQNLDRQQAVRSSLQKLRQLIVELAMTIYGMQLTEEQVSELADKMVKQLSESMNDITIERVKDLANDLLLGVDYNNKYNKKR